MPAAPQKRIAGEQQVADGPPAGPPLQPQLEVGHRPQEDGDDGHQQQAQAPRDETAEQRCRDAGRRRHRVAREAEVRAGRPDDADRDDAADHQLSGDRHRQPDRRGEPAGGRHERLRHGEPDGRRPVDPAQDREPLAVARRAGRSREHLEQLVGGARRQQLLRRRARRGARGRPRSAAASAPRCGARRRPASAARRRDRRAGQRVVEVEARAAVDLERRAGAGRCLEEARPVERQRVTPVDDPPGSDARSRPRAGSRSLPAPGCVSCSRRLVAPGVDAGDDHVEARQQLVGVVEAGVGPDLELGAVQDPERRQLGVQAGDLGACCSTIDRASARGPRPATASDRSARCIRGRDRARRAP